MVAAKGLMGMCFERKWKSRLAQSIAMALETRIYVIPV